MTDDAVPVRRISVRLESALACLAGLLLAAVLKWPVLHHLSTGVPEDLGDPLLQAWQLSWGQHALVHDLRHVWDSNTFFPLDRTLAFSDSLLGYAPLGLLLPSTLVRYNTIFLLTYAIAFAGTYALARQLGTSRIAATVAGIGFAYAPWHLAQEGHLQILSDGGIPLSLALLARGHGYGPPTRGPLRPGLVVAGWAVAAWQVTIGFGLGLQFGYLLGILVLVFGAHWLLRRDRETPPKQFLYAEAGGAALFLVVAVTFAVPYLHVAHDHPESKRTVGDLQLFSPPLKGFVTTPADSWLLGDLQESQRDSLPFKPEMTLATGGTLVVLAVFGAVAGSWPRRRRIALAAGAVVLLVLAMGTRFVGGGRFTYLVLFHHAPGWEGIRTPGRLVVPLTLVLALLAASGIDRLRALSGHALGNGGRIAVGGVALALVTAEVIGTTPVQPPPPLPQALDHADGPVLVLPSDGFHDNWSMYWSANGLYPIANGNSGFVPRELDALRRGVEAFPDPASVALLQQQGIRAVVLLPAYAGGSPWQGAETKPVDGLPVQRTQVGQAVVYELAPTG